MMRKLQRKVNIVVVIGKADSLTATEVQRRKTTIINDLEKHEIRDYPFPVYDSDDNEDEDLKRLDLELQAAAPYAVVASDIVLEVGGKRICGRQYPWGIVDVHNPQHCDFVKLRTMLFSTHMQDLKDVTQDVYYENFREQCMAQISQRVMTERGKLKRDTMGNNNDVVAKDIDRLILQTEEEIRRMQDLLNQMKENLIASHKKT